MNVVKSEDFIISIASSLQHISYCHPPDFLKAMFQAYQKEKSSSAKKAISQILSNSRMCVAEQRPICQDTGIITAFIKIGTKCRFDSTLTIHQMINEGVIRAYTDSNNPLRKSIVAPPIYGRINTKNNTPAVVYTDFIEGDFIEVKIAAKGGGSENKSKSAILSPTDDVFKWIIKVVSKMGAGWCPPGILGIGIGGTIDKAMVLAKEAIMEPVNIHELIDHGPTNKLDELRLKTYNAVNQLGIGAQGLGGITTVLDVKIFEYPTHAASLPIAIIPNCSATRHLRFKIDGKGPYIPKPAIIRDWPEDLHNANNNSKRVHLDRISKEEIRSWKAGETLLINGKLLTGRDAAHERIKRLLDKGNGLPEGVKFNGRFIYYVGPIEPICKEVIGPAGPTTSKRMDKYTEIMLGKLGIIGMIGKGERGDNTIDLIKKYKAVYLIATGGAAYLISKSIKKYRIVAFEELGMEAIYEFTIEDMPTTVAVDSNGNAIHKTGPAFWRK